MPLTKEQLDNTYTYHRPHGDQPQRYERVRAAAKTFALTLLDNCPDSRERSVAMTNLQQSVMWANASIAINEAEAPPPLDPC